jgi:radical SAM superfamily enzyme YgiQ (UPF0313 family)
LGLAYLAAYLKQVGFKPHILDFNTHPMDDGEFQSFLQSKKWLLIGISFMSNQFGEASRLATLIKNALPQVCLVAGGPHPSSIPERTLQEIPSIDIIVKGEGEETLRELAETIAHCNNYNHIDGICFRSKAGIVKTPDRALIEALDQLPHPAWEYFDVKKYNVFHIGGVTGNSSAFALLSSRGCPNFCTFCDSHTIFSRRFRARSAKNLFEEIMQLHKTFGMMNFDFVDDLFTVQKKRVLEFCNILLSSGIAFRWMANARVNTVDAEMLTAMKNAGCVRVDFGVESGDINVRKLMKKNITNDQIREAHLTARRIGLSTGTFTMVGNMGESNASIRKTVELLREIADDVMVSIACPFPGTELYRIAKEQGLLNTENWTNYVTSPTYKPDYRPVMKTDMMNEREILSSFYYLHSFFARRKFQHRFGRFFIFNLRFYREWVFKPEGFQHRLKMSLALIGVRLKRILHS